MNLICTHIRVSLRFTLFPNKDKTELEIEFQVYLVR